MLGEAAYAADFRLAGRVTISPLLEGGLGELLWIWPNRLTLLFLITALARTVCLPECLCALSTGASAWGRELVFSAPGFLTAARINVRDRSAVR